MASRLIVSQRLNLATGVVKGGGQMLGLLRARDVRQLGIEDVEREGSARLQMAAHGR